jgi:recombination protein RecA
MIDQLDKVIFSINKKFGENTIGKISEMPTIKTARISSGSPYLDWCTGGGFPLGRTIELFGPYSAGKSLVALRTIAEAQKQGLNCIYLDAENAFDPNFAKLLGVDVDNLVISQISAGEEIFDMIDMLLKSNVAVIVIDSVASLVPQYELDESIEKQTMALQARMMSKALRRLTSKASKNKTLIFFINQIREKLGSYGNPEITAGGRALGFYASLRIEVRKGELLKDEKKIIGQVVKFKVTKSKICQPYRDGYFIFYHPNAQNPNLELFDTADELVSMLLIQGKIQRRGAYFDVAGKTFQGREELQKEIKDNPNFRKELDKLWKEEKNV